MASEVPSVTQESAAGAAAVLAEVEALHERGLSRQAWEHGRGLGPLERWPGRDGRLLAARLAWAFADRRLGDALVDLAWRADRRHPAASYYHGSVLVGRRGPLFTWHYLRRVGELPDAAPELRADWLALHAHVLSRLRDFARAHSYLERAHASAAERPWVWVEHARVLEAQDRRVEALEASDRALALRRDYRPALLGSAGLLLELGREEEALARLAAASPRLESSAVTRRLLGLLMELERWDEARAALERLLEVTPLQHEGLTRWVCGQRSELAYHSGDLEAAREWATQAGGGFFAALAERLASPPPEPRRRQLAVRFVRQHFKTCGPATLSALAAYWERAVDHAALSAQICYDGTPDHVERHWAERSGFATAEFRVTWDAARALLDRGVPFTVTTGGATWAHLQAVIGYDDRRGTFTVLEPGSHARCEYQAQVWLEDHRSFGPRGLALVPEQRRELLDGLELPDAALYEQRYQLKRALAEHRRDDALAHCWALGEAACEHALAIDAIWSIACYDGDPETGLRCATRLLQLYPQDPRLELAKLGLLRSQASREELLAYLGEIARRPDSDPVFARELCEVQLHDARCWGEVRWRLGRLLPQCPADPALYRLLADLAQREGRLQDAFELYRFASCQAPTDEWLAERTFQIARLLQRAEEGLAYLRERVAALGSQSGQPWITLCEALGALARGAQAFAELDAALEQRPDDMELALFAAEQHAAHGRRERAGALLARAQGAARRAEWLAVAARLARLDGDTERELALARELGELAPLRTESHAPALQALHRSRGPQAVRGYARAMLARAPDHLGVQQLGIEWLRGDAAAAQAALRAVLQRHPAFGWARRELARLLAEQGCPAQAKPEAEEALRLDPRLPDNHVALGVVLLEQGDRAGARAAWREALRLDIDQGFALRSLVDACEDDAGRRAELHWIAGQLEVQPVFGAGLAAYRDAARATLSGEEVMALLERELAARPELRSAWSEAIDQRIELGQLALALELAQRAAERFAHDARSWYDVGRIQGMLLQATAACAAFERAVELAPGWDGAVRELSDAYVAAGRSADARALLERAVARAPRDERFRGFLAELCARSGELERGRAELERALELEPGYGWAWNQHRDWSRRLREPGATLAFARRLAQERPRDVPVQLELAQELCAAGEGEAALAVLEQAQAAAPRELRLHDRRAYLLCELGRTEAALAACVPAAVFGERVPTLLRARHAWVQAQSGRAVQAIEAIREVLADDPDLIRGWSWLSEWCEQEQRCAEAIEAARWWVRLRPGSADAWERLGLLLLEQGDQEGARSAFTRGLEASPECLGAGLGLLDLLIGTGEPLESGRVLEAERVREAERVLEVVDRHGGGAFGAVRELRLARQLGQVPRELRCAQRIARQSCSSDWPLRELERLWSRPGAAARPDGQGAFEELLAAEIAADRASAQALLLHAERLAPEQLPARIGALDRALLREPGFERAERALADALRDAGRLDEAQRRLEALAAADPQQALNPAHLAHVHAARGELALAAACAERALLLEPELDRAWSSLEQWRAQLGEPGAVLQFARRLTRERPRCARAWQLLADAPGGADTLEERIGAARRLTELAPRDADHWDLLAQRLCEAARWDEARAACAPAVFTSPPLALRGRALLIEAQCGEKARALREMKALLEQHPHYGFGWFYACTWARECEPGEPALHLAQRMRDALPEWAESHECLAQALEASGKTAEAGPVWLRANELGPLRRTSFYAAFDYSFAQGLLDVAERVLQPYIERHRHEFTLARAVQVAAARRRRDEALALFRELCAASQSSDWPLQTAWRALRERRWGTRAQCELERALAEERVDTRAVQLWVRAVAVPSPRRRTLTRLLALLEHPRWGRLAAETFLDHGQLDRRGRRVCRALGERLRSDARLWASYGGLLLRAQRHRRAARWLADWRERADLEPWMLAHVVSALRCCGQRSAAAQACELALGRCSGAAVGVFAAWTALEHALAGRSEQALSQLRGLASKDRDEIAQLICELAEACLAARGAVPLEPLRGRARATRAISLLRRARPRVQRLRLRELRLAYLDAAALVARLGGGVRPRLWYLNQWLRVEHARRS